MGRLRYLRGHHCATHQRLDEPQKPFHMSKRIHGLERHRYAPELNTLHYTDGTEVRVPQCTTIDEAVNYLKNKQK
tara:strand:- start:493 stop:717 length:225 start_codon:yes stop_codon:yes gene_type:complete